MAQAWHLMSRPAAMPQPSDFALKDVALAPMAPGLVHVRNTWLSVDPYMRGRMNDVKSYVPPFALGEPMDGGAIGEVVASEADGYAPGDKVLHMAGWRDEVVLPAQMLVKIPDWGIPEQAWLGHLGITGLTAWAGLIRVAEAKEGDTVFVSAAAGAVGMAVVQIAKARGMTVIGSAGGAEKCALLRELGADAAIDYKAPGSLVRKLIEAAPKGIDVYFDNVGGDHLDAALAVARDNARFAICGMIEGYNDATPTQLRFMMRIISARIALRGFIVTDYAREFEDARRELADLIKAGKLATHETVHDGLGSTPDAFLGLFSGGNTGKMLVRL